MSATANGMLISLRQEFADFALDLGIFGREGFRFDGSDPRFTGELLHGPLDAGGGAFGGDHWAEEFGAIRTGNKPEGRPGIVGGTHGRRAELDLGLCEDDPGTLAFS